MTFSLGFFVLLPWLLRPAFSGGEAEWYEGIKVKYIHGRTAIMTIYEDGKEKEKITMHELKDRKAMHAHMLEKGFKRKSQEEMERITNDIKAAEEKRKSEIEERFRARREKVAQKHPMLSLAKTDDNVMEEDDEKKTSLRLQQSVDLHKERESDGSAANLLRRKEKEMLVAMAGPTSSSMSVLTLAGAAAMVGLVIIGIASRRAKRNRAGRK